MNNQDMKFNPLLMSLKKLDGESAFISNNLIYYIFNIKNVDKFQNVDNLKLALKFS